MNNETPAQASGIKWPELAISKKAGPEWLSAGGHNQAIFDCQAAYNRHVELYESHPAQTYLVDGWPRDASRASIQQKDYVSGYQWALSIIEKEFAKAQEHKIGADATPSSPARKTRKP